ERPAQHERPGTDAHPEQHAAAERGRSQVGRDRVDAGQEAQRQRGERPGDPEGDQHPEDGPARRPAPTGRYVHPTLSIISTACCSAGPARSPSIGSILTPAQSLMCAGGGTSGLAANSLPAMICCCAGGEVSHSMSATAVGTASELATTPTPETFACAPAPCWSGHAGATGKSGFSLSARPR